MAATRSSTPNRRDSACDSKRDTKTVINTKT